MDGLSTSARCTMNSRVALSPSPPVLSASGKTRGGEGMGWAFPRDKEGVKIREGVGCCDGELVHRYFDSCRCPSIIRATLPVPLVFFYFFLFSFPFLFFFSSLLLFMSTFVVHRPAHDSTRRRRRCLSMEVGVKMETRFVSFPRIVVKVEDVWVLNV